MSMVKLVAMADVFVDRLKPSFDNLKYNFPDKLDVPEDRKFIGLDAYKKAMDCLKPGDVVILTTPPAFRWVHFTEAIKKNLNVFMEKPVTVDGPTSRRMFKLADEAKEKNLKVGVGLMCRHCKARWELYDRIKQGEIGEITLIRAYRLDPPLSSFATNKGQIPKDKELLSQIRRFLSFLWASGGGFSDFMIHNIDESCWMKDAWPVKAQALGGRHYRGDSVDQNFDTYSVEYTFPDGTTLMAYCRNMVGCFQRFASFAHGTKGSAVISTSAHTPARCRIYKGHNQTKRNLVWSYPQPETNPYELEWQHLFEAIRNDKPYNEVRRGTEASLVTAMGRMAAHTGQVITYEQILNCNNEFAPDIDKLTMDGMFDFQVEADVKIAIRSLERAERRKRAWRA